MKQIHLVGIGAGAPGHLTLDAVDALRAADVIFLLDKEEPGKDEFSRLRRELLDRVRPEHDYKLVTASSPVRAMAEATYDGGIETWRRERRAIIARLLDELAEDHVAAFLVWGDPCLYDGMIQLLRDMKSSGQSFDFKIVPGISSVQALAAAHKVPLNRVGEVVTISPARRLREVAPTEITNTVVMLDSRAAFKELVGEGLDIYWGAYLGTEDEVLIAGTLDDTAAAIEQAVADGRRRKGWIMDTYILRRPQKLDGEDAG